MHSYPLEKAAPNGEIFKRFLYINILMCYALPLVCKKIFPHNKVSPVKDKDLFNVICPTLCVPKLDLQDRTSLLRRQGASAFCRSRKALPLSGTPKPSRRLMGIFKKRER